MDTSYVDQPANISSAAVPIETEILSTFSTVVNLSQSLIPLKLTATNYCAWHVQFDSLLIGYDFYGFIDGSTLCPPATLSSPNTPITAKNPAYTLWVCQNKLLLNAINGSPSLFLPYDFYGSQKGKAWFSLEKTCSSPSRGRIMVLRRKLANLVKGSRTITEYMLDIQSYIYSLAFMNKLIDFDDLTICICHSLDDGYTNLSNTLQTRETLIESDELFEKLLHIEALLNHWALIPMT